MASSCASVGLDRTVGKLSSLKGWLSIRTGCPGKMTIPGEAEKGCGCGTRGYSLVVVLV